MLPNLRPQFYAVILSAHTAPLPCPSSRTYLTCVHRLLDTWVSDSTFLNWLISGCRRLHRESRGRAASAVVPGWSLPALLPWPCHQEHQATGTLALWGGAHPAHPRSHQRALHPPALLVFSVLLCTRGFPTRHEVNRLHQSHQQPISTRRSPQPLAMEWLQWLQKKSQVFNQVPIGLLSTSCEQGQAVEVTEDKN